MYLFFNLSTAIITLSKVLYPYWSDSMIALGDLELLGTALQYILLTD